MAMSDSLTLVLISFGLIMMGWFSEFVINMSTDMVNDINPNPVILSMADTLRIFTYFVHSNYFLLIVSLFITNLIISSRSTLNPIYAGILAAFNFILIYALNYYFIPIMFETLFNLNGLVSGQFNWQELFQSTWYLLALSGLFGSLIAYARGTRVSAFGQRLFR